MREYASMPPTTLCTLEKPLTDVKKLATIALRPQAHGTSQTTCAGPLGQQTAYPAIAVMQQSRWRHLRMP